MNRFSRRFLPAILGFLLIGAITYVAKRNNASIPGASDVSVHAVASFYPLAFFASQVAGTNAAVTNLTPAGAEPHDYEPSAREIVQIEQSDLLILNGGRLESWGQKIQDELKGSHTVVVTAGDGLTTKELVEDGQSIQDPHVWLSPPLAKQEVERIAQAFEQADAAHAASYATNAQALETKLDALDQKFEAGLASCTQHDIVTSHAAFGYLAARYHLMQVSISGVSPDAEPSAQKLAEVSNLVRTKGIKYIFFESLVSPKLSETIASETGAKALVLDPIEGLSDEDLRAGKNYFTQMESNLANLRLALQCQ
jgi:zinc transport system substrate-binding protein